MIIPIKYFEDNAPININIDGYFTGYKGQKQFLISHIHNVKSIITITELEKSYTKDPNSQLELIQDVTVYFNLIYKNKQSAATTNNTIKSKYSWLTTLLLCWFLGILGAHRFYVGRSVSGIVQLLTLGGLGIWTLIDFFIILSGKFEDEDGEYIAKE